MVERRKLLRIIREYTNTHTHTKHIKNQNHRWSHFIHQIAIYLLDSYPGFEQPGPDVQEKVIKSICVSSNKQCMYFEQFGLCPSVVSVNIFLKTKYFSAVSLSNLQDFLTYKNKDKQSNCLLIKKTLHSTEAEQGKI